MSTGQRPDKNPKSMPDSNSRGAKTDMKPAVHYNPGSEPGPAACGLPDVPPERLTADLDAVTCGNCLSGLRWRNDMSQRTYKGDYERFYGPGGFLDRAGQTMPASATTAPQARAALEKQAAGEIAKVAALGSRGAGSDVIARAVRDAVRTVMLGADACIRLTAADRADQVPPRAVTFGLDDLDVLHVLTTALEDYEAKERDLAAFHDAGESRERWANLARAMRKAAETATG